MLLDFKPMPSVGSGAYEVRVRDAGGAWRTICVAKFANAVYVLHAFKKGRRRRQKPILNAWRGTPASVLDLAQVLCRKLRR